jgi:hypothetical protein
MPEQDQTWVYRSDGPTEVVEVEPYYCELCNLNHNINIKIPMKHEDVSYFLILKRCNLDIVKYGVDMLIITHQHLSENYIFFNSTHERDLCYNVFINNPR